MMATQGHSHASEALKQYVQKNLKGKQVLYVPEGKYKGWVPRIIYSMHLEEVSLPFLKLASFPVGGTAIGNLVTMKYFSAQGNYLHHLPKSFGNCKYMEKLNLSFNLFQQIPASVFCLESLVELDFSENELQSISSDIGNLKCLRIVKLGGNLLSDVPDELGKCKKIEHLILSHKWYPRQDGLKQLPKAACSLKELQYLDVSWHQIHTIPDEVGNLGKLEILNMRGNFLKYVSANIAQCKCLQELNLTGAMKLNSIIPEELFLLSELKNLNISNNYFSEISPEIKGLKKLKKFIMRCNALLRIPAELFELKYLEMLELGDNYLEVLPDDVKKLKKLRTLELQGNKLASLPEGLCNCVNLEQLFLANNELQELPDAIYKLGNLKELDLQSNQLRKLPMLMDKLEQVEATELLSVANNYLKTPPQELCNQGVKAIYNYLRELRMSEARHRRKMILIGAAKAGKTSLRNALILGRSKLTLEHERTWVLERHLWEPEADLRVQVLDFGGHHIYSAAHHMFLTPEALHVLVFDLSKYSSDQYDSLIGNWVDAIMDRAPGAAIKIVGTHMDMCNADEIEEKTEEILSKLHSDEKGKLDDLKISFIRAEEMMQSLNVREVGSKFEDIDVQRLREKRANLQKMLNTRTALPHDITVVSCADDLSGVRDLTLELQNRLKESDEQPMPKSWHKFLQAIQEKRDKILHFEQALHIFNDTMNSMQESMMSLEVSPASSLEMVLRYLHTTGEIVWYYDNPNLKNIVFHRPDTLVEMLRVIFRHDFDQHVMYNETYGKLANLSAKKFDMMKEEFLTKGLMMLEMLHFCLLHFKLTVEARDTFIDLMIKFDLCYEVPKYAGVPSTFASSRILKFPWFLSADMPQNFEVKWPSRKPPDIIEIQFNLHFPSKTPPNFFEKTSARLQHHILQREDWRDGVVGSRNSTRVLIKREPADGGTDVIVTARGSDLQEIWYILTRSHQDMMSLLQEWPFVRFEQYILCTHCTLRGEEEPYMYPGEILQQVCPQRVYRLQCCPKDKDAYIPACLVYPLDADFQEDIGEHIKVVKEFLQNYEDTVDSGGPGLLTDFGLSYIAARLGVEWTLVSLALGLTQPEIEQIQLDNPYQVVKQITTALIRWRDRLLITQSQKALLEQLFEALESQGRMDLVDEIREKYVMQEDKGEGADEN